MHDEDEFEVEVEDCVSDLIVEIMERQLPQEALQLVLATLPHVLVHLHVVDSAISGEVVLQGAQLGEKIANDIKQVTVTHAVDEAIERAVAAVHNQWTCLACREENEPASVACHKCGADRPR